MPFTVQHTHVTKEPDKVETWQPGDKEPEKRNLIRWYVILMKVVLS